MRDIKFRAWDAENGKMYTPTHEAYKGNLFELLVSFSGDLSAHTMEGMEHESLWPNRFQLMQYTGLKDKNGVEIYEGDVLASYIYGDEKWLVEFEDGCFWIHDKIAPDWPLEFITVIGNTYENPELLEANQ